MRATDSERGQLIRWSFASESAYRIKAAIELARSEPGIPIVAAELDPNPMFLAVKNGVVDLRKGTLIPANRDQLITKQAGTEFHPTATCPMWMKFIHQITAGDEDLGFFLQRVAGYLLTGLTNEQCLFMLLGRGSQGKIVLSRLLQILLGDYALTTPPTTLLAKRDTSGPTPDLARLRGARLVVASEPTEGWHWRKSS